VCSNDDIGAQLVLVAYGLVLLLVGAAWVWLDWADVCDQRETDRRDP
jgi:hypothetical protein